MDVEIEERLINSIPGKYTPEADIPIIHTTYNYNSFFENFMLCNKPCVITGIAENWSATKHWVKGGQPNFDYLKEKYGECNVTVYDCEEKYYNSQKTKTNKFAAYVDYWIDLKKNEAQHLYYLKDWHMKNTYPHDDFYDVAPYFTSDWLNEYLTENRKDDYRFVYMGPEKTWTPFHQDVFSSYSWSVNVCGQKRWVLFPPGEEVHLKDSLGNLPYDITNATEGTLHYELIQSAGEAIFVPSGWFHQVWNLADTISVNHNWVNGCNIYKMWQSLKANLEAVKKEIEDCKDMDDYLEHCQIMLEASYGLNFIQFYHFIKYITVKRMTFIDKNQADTGILNANHALFDLKRIEHVLGLFLEMEDVRYLSKLNYDNAVKLLGDIRHLLFSKYLL